MRDMLDQHHRALAQERFQGLSNNFPSEDEEDRDYENAMNEIIQPNHRHNIMNVQQSPHFDSIDDDMNDDATDLI